MKPTPHPHAFQKSLESLFSCSVRSSNFKGIQTQPLRPSQIPVQVLFHGKFPPSNSSRNHKTEQHKLFVHAPSCPHHYRIIVLRQRHVNSGVRYVWPLVLEPQANFPPLVFKSFHSSRRCAALMQVPKQESPDHRQ